MNTCRRTHTYCRPQILKMNGMFLSDFKHRDEALAVADELIKQNQADLEFTPEEKDHANPLLKQFFYVQNHGKKRTWTQLETKSLEMESAVKNQKQMEEVGAFIEGLGPASSESAAGSSTAQEEDHAGFRAMKDSQEQLRTSYLIVRLTCAPPGEEALLLDRGGAQIRTVEYVHVCQYR